MPSLTDNKVETIAYHVEKILEALQVDTRHAPFVKTPMRVAKMYADELCKGLDPNNFPKLHFEAFNGNSQNHVVVLENISLQSLCAHHLLPFFGTCMIKYVPNQKILGLSKVSRVVDFLASKPTLQERLTQEIAATLSQALDTLDIYVAIKAKHLCVTLRGIQDRSQETTTHVSMGSYRLDTQGSGYQSHAESL